MNNNTRYKLLDQNNINAAVMTQWSRAINPNCKFLPNNKVTVKWSAKRDKTRSYRHMIGEKGTVIAVTTVNGYDMVGSSTRKYSKYYVAFPGSKVVGVPSYHLRSAE